MTRKQIQELETALDALLANQAEANASIEPAQQGLTALTALKEAECTLKPEDNQDEK